MAAANHDNIESRLQGLRHNGAFSGGAGRGQKVLVLQNVSRETVADQ
jgi:hypothetical protein